MDISDNKYSYEIDHISNNYKVKVTEDIEFLKLGKLSSQKHIDSIENIYDESNRMDMSDDKKSDEINRISNNDEWKVTEDIEVLKLVKWSSQKNIENIEKYSDETNRVDVSDDKDSDERYHTSKNNKEKVTDGIEVLKMVNWIRRKI